MVGRDGVVDRLQAALTASRAGVARHVVVGGEAGVGKTRMLSRTAELAETDGARVLVGGCVAIGPAGLPFAPYSEIVRALISRDGAPSVATFAGHAAPDLARLVPELDLDGAPVAHESWARSRLYEALLSVFRHLAKRSPVVVMVEDVHWADVETLAATSFLMHAVRDEPISIVATFRSDSDARTAALRAWLADIARDGNVERIDLEPLGEADLVTLVLNILGSELDPTELADIRDRSDGNPFFVEELLASRGHAGAELPTSLRDVLLTRVDRLEPTARSLLGVAGIGGREVEHDLLLSVAERSPGDAAVDLGGLVDAGLLVPTRAAGGDDAYSFRHALLQEAVCDAVLPAERRRLHGAWADGLADRGGARSTDAAHLVRLAHHWRAARDPRALVASIEAGDAAVAGFSYQIALSEYEAALEIWDEDAAEVETTTDVVDHAGLLARASRAAFLASDLPRAVAMSRQALDELRDGDLARATELRIDLARVLWITGEWGPSIRNHEEAVRIAPHDPPMTRTRALAGLGQVYMDQGYWERARTLVEEALERARTIGARQLEGHALISLSIILANYGEHQPARTAAEEGLAIAIEVGNPEDVGRSYSALGEVMAKNGSPDAALAVSLKGVDVAVEYGMTKSYGTYFRYASVEYAFECGDWEEVAHQLAESNRSSGLRESTELSSAYLVVAHHVLEYLVCSGATEAEQMWKRIGPLLASQPPSNRAGPIYVGAIELAAFAGRYEEAVDVGWEGLEQLRQTDGWIEIAELARMTAWPLAETGIAAVARDDPDEIKVAEQRLDHLLELIERAKDWLGRPDGLLGSYVDLLGFQVEGEWARMHGAAEPERWRSVAEGLAGINRPYRALMARWREAEAAYSSGDRDTAAKVAREAYREASDLGAKPLVAQLEQLGRKMRIRLASTSRTETDAASAPFGLTSREREVLTLVAAGRTNRQIADALFISKSTAGVHVSNILSKLGVDTRKEAASVALGEGLGPER